MKIHVKLMGMLKEKTPVDGVIELPGSSNLGDLLAALEIDSQAIQACSVNGGIKRDVTTALRDGDEVTILPPVGGG